MIMTTIRVQMKHLNFGDVTTLPLTEISSRDLGVRRIQEEEPTQGSSIKNSKIQIAGAKGSLGLQVAYPLTDKPRKYT
jgi:FlaA1/EpsC-like NDP-sugar epimerase